jgi:hypothetical protein
VKKSTKVQQQGAKVSGSGKKPAPSDPSHPSSELRTPALNPGAAPGTLLTDVRELIVSTRQTVARGVNAALLLYWKVGERIRRDVLREKQAEYGEEIVSTLSAQLAAAFAGLFTLPILSRTFCRVATIADLSFVATASRQLTLLRLAALLPLNPAAEP